MCIRDRREADVYNYPNSYFCGKVVINFRFPCAKFWKSDFTNSFMTTKNSSCLLGRELFYYQILVSYARHAKCLEVRVSIITAWPHGALKRNASACESAQTKFIEASFPKLGLKTVNAVPVKNRCFFFSISLKPAAWTLFFYDLALSSESSDQGPIATLSGINRSFINTVLNNITMSSHGT